MPPRTSKASDRPTTPSRPRIDRLPEWKALAKHKKEMEKTNLRKLFARDPKRGRTFTADALGIHFDYAKNLVNAKTMKLLFALARAAGLEERRNAITDSRQIRTSALLARVTTFTTIFGAEAAVDGMRYMDDLDVISVQEMHAQLATA